MRETMMRFELGEEALELAYDSDEGMFDVTLGPASGGTRCTVGTHCERSMGVFIFNHELQAMQSKWEEET